MSVSTSSRNGFTDRGLAGHRISELSSHLDLSEETTGMTKIAVLLDVDNTLLDNDKAKADLETRVDSLLGPERGRSFWEVYERVRRECDFVDFPRTLVQFKAAFLDERSFPHLAALVLCYPYEDCVFPGVLQT